MEFGQQMQEAKDNAKLAFYQNPNYQYERLKNKTITIRYPKNTLLNKDIY